jgi:hypothetical protein
VWSRTVIAQLLESQPELFYHFENKLRRLLTLNSEGMLLADMNHTQGSLVSSASRV